MNPILVAIAGPLRGSTFAVGDELTIGRQSSNRIAIPGRSVSRHHCVIRRDLECFRLTDLDSLEGTFVNGLPIHEKVLALEDEIAVSDSVFVFVLTPADLELPPPPVELAAGGPDEASSVTLRPEDAVYLRGGEAGPGPSPTIRMGRELRALLLLAGELGGARTLADLAQRVLERVAEVVPAERGCIVLTPAGGAAVEGGFEEVFPWTRRGAPERPIRLSRPVVERVVSEKISLMNNDLETSADLSPAGPDHAPVRALLCAPLVMRGQVTGALYLETSEPGRAFEDGHLQLVTAVGALAASAVETARHIDALAAETELLRADLGLAHGLIGESASMREVHDFIRRAGPTESTVLIRGESGTGKELAARALHAASERHARPFVAIHCAALAESLIESELFGHERGSFTGAVAMKRGKLEVADRGTVFLDEVGELSAMLQVKLLRVLQEREFERVGGTRPLRVDIRVVAATNRDLEAAMRAGTFRQDLYYRLNVLSLAMPPLRARREDIPLLAAQFVAKHARRIKGRPMHLSAGARAGLVAYDWPGNVRELENAIERAVVLGGGDAVLADDLPESILEVGSASRLPGEYHVALQELKKTLVRDALSRSEGNQAEAARRLGIHPNYLSRLIRNLDLKATLGKKA